MAQAADFEGTWRLERRIADVGSRRLVGRFRGEARFARSPDGDLDYLEEGALLLPQGGSFKATRRYLWRFDGPLLRVFFDDGRPFWEVDAAGGGIGSAHLCGADLYRARLVLSGWPRWRLAWRVTGPRKDLVIASRFWREAGTGG